MQSLLISLVIMRHTAPKIQFPHAQYYSSFFLFSCLGNREINLSFELSNIVVCSACNNFRASSKSKRHRSKKSCGNRTCFTGSIFKPKREHHERMHRMASTKTKTLEHRNIPEHSWTPKLIKGFCIVFRYVPECSGVPVFLILVLAAWNCCCKNGASPLVSVGKVRSFQSSQ